MDQCEWLVGSHHTFFDRTRRLLNTMSRGRRGQGAGRNASAAPSGLSAEFLPRCRWLFCHWASSRRRLRRPASPPPEPRGSSREPGRNRPTGARARSFRMPRPSSNGRSLTPMSLSVVITASTGINRSTRSATCTTRSSTSARARRKCGTGDAPWLPDEITRTTSSTSRRTRRSKFRTPQAPAGLLSAGSPTPSAGQPILSTVATGSTRIRPGTPRSGRMPTRAAPSMCCSSSDSTNSRSSSRSRRRTANFGSSTRAPSIARGSCRNGRSFPSTTEHRTCRRTVSCAGRHRPTGSGPHCTTARG